MRLTYHIVQASSNRNRRNNHLFRFKQFEVDQQHCAMKINTDGVLLGALAELPLPGKGAPQILDVGTGTGVISLMLAQRFSNASIDAIDIDLPAATQAKENFNSSPFHHRLHAQHLDLRDFGTPQSTFNRAEHFDLIVSNPPFFLNSLKNPDARKQQARHADTDFFQVLLHTSQNYLHETGSLQLILPPALAETLADTALNHYSFLEARHIRIYSFATDAKPIRHILQLQKAAHTLPATPDQLIIYDAPGAYSRAYRSLLSDFFLAF